MTDLNHWRGTTLLLTALFVIGHATSVSAQKAPGAGYVFPAGGAAGTTVDIKLGGYDWTPDTQFLLHDTSCKLEVTVPPGEVLPHLPPYWFGIKSMVNDPPLPREVSARIVLPGDLPAGPIRWCVANANGGSPCGLFFVGHGPEVLENESDTSPQKLAKIPVTVNGRLLRIEEVDRYQFQLETSGLVTCDLIARRLGSDFFGVMEILDASGKTIAKAFDTEGQDPILTFFAQAGQPYTVLVRDLDYRGYRSLTYRLSITTGPRVLATLPAASRRGETRPIEFVGIGVASGEPKLERTIREVTSPADTTQTHFSYRLQTPFGEASEIPIPLSDLTEQVEPDSVDPVSHRLTVPAAMTGHLNQAGGKDTYPISGHTGDVWNVTVQTRCLGSPFDPMLVVIGPDGKALATNDDAPGTTDSRLSITLPTDGEYQVVVSDISGSRDLSRSIYRLVVETPGSRFLLRTNGLVNLPISVATANLEGTVLREGGLKEPIKLTVTGLPAGVTAPAEVTIDPAAAAFKIPLTIEPTSPVSSSFVQIIGTAQLEDKTLVTKALAPGTGSLVIVDPESNLVPVILMTTTLKPPFKIKPTEADGGRRVNRGATHLAELIVERDPGFSGEILLDMSAAQSRHRQGIFGPSFVIAPGLRTVEYPVFVPECLETARTSRIGLVAMARILDPKGTQRTVVGLVEGQITMSIEGALLKLTHTADELIVPIGQSFVVPLKLARARTLTGTVSVELQVPQELSELIEAKPIAFVNGQESADWTITIKPDPRLLGSKVLTARATTMRDGHPVISECEIHVEFVPALSSPIVP